MQQVNPTILNTPLSIYRALQAASLAPDINLELRNPGITLHIRFSQQLPVLSLINAVDAKEFQETVQRVKIYLESMRLFGTGIQPILLDPSRFSVSAPLLDWQEYSRFIHQNTGRSCTDALMTFLQNPSVSNEVSRLGLAPNQIDEQATVDELAYFKEFVERLRGVSQEQKQLLLLNFERQYPNIFRQLINEKVAQERRAQTQETNNFYHNTLTILKQQVIGQDQAVTKMTAMLATQTNLESNKVFLFAGPSGVGKTELAKAVSKTRENRFVMLQMQTFQEEHHSSKIFGSPPGYVGSTDKPGLAQELDKYRPVLVSREGTTETYHVSNVVILFDEFEKAHSRIKQSLLTLFDEGIYAVQYTKGDTNITCRYMLKKCIIVITSNLYKEAILKAFSDGHSADEIIELFKKLNRDLPNRDSLSTELIGRMSVVPFGPIPRGEHYQKIIRLKLTDFCNELRQEFACKLVDIEQEAAVLSNLETKLYGDGTDIRRFRRYFDDIKPAIYENCQHWGPMANKKLTFCCVEGVLCIKISMYIEDFLTYGDLGVPPLRLT